MHRACHHFANEAPKHLSQSHAVTGYDEIDHHDTASDTCSTKQWSSRYDIDIQGEDATMYNAEFVHFRLNVIHTKIDLNLLSRLESRQT